MSYFINRTACDVLEELRECNKTRNFSPILGLCHELQIMCNKMEAGLYDQKDIQKIAEKKSKLKEELKELEKRKKELESVVGKVEAE